VRFKGAKGVGEAAALVAGLLERDHPLQVADGGQGGAKVDVERAPPMRMSRWNPLI